MICTAPDGFADTTFWDDPGDDLLAKGWLPEDDIFVFAFDAGMPTAFEIAAETTGGDFPRLEDRLE